MRYCAKSNILLSAITIDIPLTFKVGSLMLLIELASNGECGSLICNPSSVSSSSSFRSPLVMSKSFVNAASAPKTNKTKKKEMRCTQSGCRNRTLYIAWLAQTQKIRAKKLTKDQTFWKIVRSVMYVFLEMWSLLTVPCRTFLPSLRDKRFNNQTWCQE